MRVPLPIIFISILCIFYLTLPDEKCIIKNEADVRMYRKTIAKLETEMGDLAARLRMKDSELTTLKRSK